MSKIEDQQNFIQEQVNYLSASLLEKDKEIAKMLAQTNTFNEFEKQTLELQLIQYKHLQEKLENENQKLRDKIQQLINQQFDNQKTLLKQKQQIQKINTNLHSLNSSIKEEDSPIKQVLSQLIEKDIENQQLPAINLEQQMQMNELKRKNNQLLQKISTLEEKQHNLIAKQFQDAANLVKLKKEKQNLVDKLEVQGVMFSQELLQSRLTITTDVFIQFSTLYDGISNLDQVKQLFETLIIQILQLLLLQTPLINESATPIGSSHRSTNSKKIDQVYNTFSDILKMVNNSSQKFKESIVSGTQENQIYESFIYEKPQQSEKQTQTAEEGEMAVCQVIQKRGISLESAKSRELSPLYKQSTCPIMQNSVATQTEENQYMLSSLSPLMLTQIPYIKTEEDNIVDGNDEQMLGANLTNEYSLTAEQMREVIEQLTVQLNYVKKQWHSSIDKCLQAQEELSRLAEIEAQYDFLGLRFLASEKELIKLKLRFEKLLTEYFVLETSQNQNIQPNQVQNSAL